jgi:two-component system, OmpR family, sensor histidine kinase KdpD
MSVVSGSESVESLIGHEVVEQVADTVWRREDAVARKKAPLRVYLGAAPGVGKTYAMLSEGHRRADRGSDVVVGFVETYGRKHTIELVEGLPSIPPKMVEYRGSAFAELDAEAVIARHPDVVLIDELAHTNVPGGRRAKRWEDVMDILAEGVAVITTVNIQHVEGLNDVVADVTGIRQRETVPDWVLGLADQVELVDMSPYALQRRMVHGNVYPDPRKAELALRRFFTMENLTALRQLALMFVAEQVDADLLERWSRGRVPETRERVLVAVSRPDFSDDLVRRGARLAHRARGDLFVVHVRSEETQEDRAWIADTIRLVGDLGGTFDVVRADDVADGLLSYAYRQHITQIVVGESLRSHWQELMHGSVVTRLIRKARGVDIHVIARKER